MYINNQSSDYARLRALPLKSVRVTGGFWAGKQAVNRQESLFHGYRMFEKHGQFHNLRVAGGNAAGEYRGYVYLDSDVYKWLEAVALELGSNPTRELREMASEVIGWIADSQWDDGYINSYYTINKPDERWSDLDNDHELYCAGHLIEAAIAYKRATGESDLLDIACRFADYIASVFGPGKRSGAPGHPEIELALVELYRETGRRTYLDLASFFIDQRGTGKLGSYKRFGPDYFQDRLPVRQAFGVEGHAVRQLYLTAGVTDLYLETGEQALYEALERQWFDMSSRKMYLTGGFGALHHGEAFGQAYELPSESSYCETCAAIAAMMWNWRMLLATGEARYADLLERSLYNGFLSGVSLDGKGFFYVNPLFSRGGRQRQEWYACACCPPNIMRQIAALGQYLATSDETGLQVHQYASSQISVQLANTGPVVLSIETDYPWGERVKILIEEASGGSWSLSLRVPGWAVGASLSINGQTFPDLLEPGSYFAHERVWQAGDQVELHLPAPARLTAPNPRIEDLRGTLAIERGPFVYCLEQVDQQPGVSFNDLLIDPSQPLESSWREDALGGVAVITATGAIRDMAEWDDRLYRSYPVNKTAQRAVKFTAIPYYAWSNRGPGWMRVWLPTESPEK